MALWAFLLLGAVGGLHCAAMCGPLALALPVTGSTRVGYLTGRVLYNGGRVVTYTVLGGLFGAIGQVAGLAGLQRWVSLIAGILILIGLVAPSHFPLTKFIARPVAWLKSCLGSLLQGRSSIALLAFGFLNGLLPCGLVYVAAAGAAASGNAVRGMEEMFAFGLGTIPLMLAVAWGGATIRSRLFGKARRLLPISVGLVAVLLIVRGLALGIPYLSPDLGADASCCVASEPALSAASH